MQSKRDNIEIMVIDETDEVIDELFESPLQNNLKKIKKSNEFVFDYVRLLSYECHEINPNHDWSYKDSPNCIKNKKTTINAINIKDNKCFQYDVPITLHYEKTEKHDERMSKIKPFINNHKQKEIKCSKHNDD